jgi:hypothetical protein
MVARVVIDPVVSRPVQAPALLSILLTVDVITNPQIKTQVIGKSQIIKSFTELAIDPKTMTH